MSVSVGIEIGAGVVRGARVERSGGQLRLLAIEEQPFDPSQADALSRALAQMRRALSISQPVIIGVPGRSAILSTVHPLVVNRQRAALAVEFELQQQLPFDLSQAAWHYQWLHHNGGGLPQSAVVAAVMRQPQLQERLAACRRAAVSVAAVSVTSVALLNACATQRTLLRAKALTLLHGVDGTSAEWVIWSAQRLHVIPVAAATPELLPQEVAASWQGLQGQWPEIAASVWMIDVEAAVAAALARVPGLQVQPFDPSQSVVMRAVRPEAAGRAAAAIGLALQGLDVVRMPLDLLAHARGAARSRRQRRAWLMAAAACAAVAMGLGVSGMLEVRRRRTRLLEALQQQERIYQQLRPEIRALLKRQQRTEAMTAALRTVAAQSPAVIETLSQVAGALPDTIWLTNVECTKRAAAIEVMVEGRAASFQDVTRLLDQLKGLKGVTAVKPLSTNVIAAPPREGDQGAGEMVAFVVQLQRSWP